MTPTETVAPTPSPWSDPPGIGRSIGIGCTIGCLVSLVGVTVWMLALGIETASAIGLGLFVAFWGGLGFGAMIGGVRYGLQIEGSLRPASAAHASHAETKPTRPKPSEPTRPAIPLPPAPSGKPLVPGLS
jgi:hypothetical protein